MKSTLIITSRSAAESPRLMELLRSISNEERDVAILFVGDGVYSLVEGSASHSALHGLARSVSLFGSKSDVESRGIAGKIASESSIVDYDQIVELMMEGCSRVVSYL